MVELADTLDLGSSAKACRFKSCRAHQNKTSLSKHGERGLFIIILIFFSKTLKNGNTLPLLSLFQKKWESNHVKSRFVGLWLGCFAII